jgi:suppressor of ftsI
VGAASAVFGCGDAHNGAASQGSSTTPRVLPEGQLLRTFPVLSNASADPGEFAATLVAAPADTMPLPGRPTTMLLYNGIGPGPLIELTEGQHVRIRLDNRLDHDSTIHWHGLPVPSDQDGNPMDPVHAGASRVYEYDIPSGTAGSYWYHPHPHATTAEQVARGLAGPLIVRAIDDPLAHVPEVNIFITGLKLNPDAQPAPDDAIDWTVGRQREKLLVNGDRLPVHVVRPGGTERWRIFNATAAAHLRLALEGHAFALVGTDGGLLQTPVTGLGEILLAPAQRIEILVTANSAPNGRYRLRALRYEADYLNLGTYIDDDLLTLATTDELPSPPLAVPGTLRPLADLGTPVARQRVELSEVHDLCTAKGATSTFLINGRIFDPDRIDLTSLAGQVELWDIVNHTAMGHPFHIHGTQFQLVSRQLGTVITLAPYLAWIDTVLVPAQQTATIKVRQALPGKRMFHCHILEHEDNCMMAILDVRPPGNLV